MQSLQARIDSFKKAKRVKRYPNKASSSTASIKWPHPSGFKANANTLAEAGFFFNPSWDDRDSVACFLCGKELSDWDASDDPFEIHYSKCQSSCAWAVVRCGLTEDLDNEGRFVFRNKSRLPSSKAMEKARLQTFGEDWPHDDEPGHGATSVKMAQAGFVYTPQGAGDDTVTCLYCNLSLSGWEKQDDPVEEHRSRDSKSDVACPFFVPTKHSTAPSKSRRKTKAARGKSAKASAPMLRRSPSPDQPVSHEQETPVLNSPHHPEPISSSPGQPTVANESLSRDERTVTLEQWIRQEIDFSYERLLTDGRQQIELFKIKAAELRKCIDDL